ncbi:hypothetical protein [Tautonia plasticadhaerens]|uniref:Uncharacterized protein n=1 Tax=Tautonia plasticadhaerens TaxID=2527974 RepID=A0A518H455_9BACT|nr:hypothetical protein [Tautonia plasticadhaerens]QDV35588.1 hypothetical protein ElP_34920 [Tautonia plasticadhaerens]
MAGNERIDLEAEVERVRGELLLFRDSILPVFYRPGGINPERADADADASRNPLARMIHRQRDWQRAATRLIEALPDSAGRGIAPGLDLATFEPFMYQPAKASFSVRGGRIVWRVMLFLDWDMAAGDTLYRMGVEDDGEAVEVLLSDLPRLRRWLLGLPVDDALLWNALCLVAPIVADADPGLAMYLLDPETYRRRVLSDRRITAEERTGRLEEIDGHFLRILNNALLHALGGLANNHFDEMPGLLGHPALLMSGYTELMPHYLFAVLFEKVSILLGLVRESTVPELP